MTSPSLTSSGAGRSRSPRRVEEHHAAAVAATPYPAAICALRPEGHARDIALLDLQRRGSEPLAPGVEEHHAAADAGARRHIPRRSCPPARRPRSLTSPSLTSSGVGRSRSPRASKSTTPPRAAAADAISRGDLALRPEGHARDIALGDVEEANDFRTRVESSVAGSPELRGCLPARGFHGQQHRQVQPFRPHRIRQDRQPTRFRDPGLSLRQACRSSSAHRPSRRRPALRCSGGDVARPCCPQRQPAGGDGEHARDDERRRGSGSRAASAARPQPRRLRPFPLRRSRGLGGFTQATLVLQFILLALPSASSLAARKAASIGAEFVAVRRGPLSARRPGAHPSRGSRPSSGRAAAHSWAASVSRRWIRKPARSASIHRRSCVQPRIRAS